MAVQVLLPLANTSRPVLLFTAPACGAWVQLQVKGGGTVTIARQSQDLLTGIGAATQGLDITANSGILNLFWIGQCFALGSVADAFIDVQLQTNTAASRVGS